MMLLYKDLSPAAGQMGEFSDSSTNTYVKNLLFTMICLVCCI